MILLKEHLRVPALRGAAIGIARGDTGEIIFATPLLESMFGYATRGALMHGAHVEDLVPLEARARHVHHRAAYAAHPSSRPMGVGLQAQGQRRDGSTFPVAVGLASEIIDGVMCVVFTVLSLVEEDPAIDLSQVALP